MTEHVLVTTAGGVTEIRMNRPDKKNALTQAMYGAMPDALEAAAADPAVRCVVLCANGESFCAGNDISDFSGRHLNATTSFGEFDCIQNEIAKYKIDNVGICKGRCGFLNLISHFNIFRI